MSMKAAAIVMSLMVYCLSLVAFQQQRDLQTLREDRISRISFHSGGWNLSGVLGGLAAGTEQSHAVLAEALAFARAAATSQAPSSDPVLVRTIHEFNGSLSTERVESLARLLEGTAHMYGVDPYLVAALVSQESAFRQGAVSPVGALGLGQLMPETAKDLGVNPHDQQENLDGCVRYLAQNLQLWSHSQDPVALALASYNAGPGAVSRYGGIPPYQETQHYVAVIKYRYDLLRLERHEA